MLKGLLGVMFRECKIIAKNKKVLIILFLVPVFFTTLFGYVYIEKSIKSLKLGIINNSPSQLSRAVENSFRKSKKFDIYGYLNNETEIAPLMEKGEINVVLIIPKSFTKDIKSGKNTTIFVGADGSNMTISNTAMTGAVEILGTVSTGIAIQKYQATGQLAEQAYNSALPLSYNIRPWYNPTVNYSNFLLLGYVTAILQQVILYFAAISITEERKKNTLDEIFEITRNSFSIILGKIIPYFLSGFVTWMVSWGIVIKIFTTPMRGSIVTLIFLSLSFIFCITAIGVFISIVSKNSLDATQYAMIIALPSFLICGYTWPFIAMPSFYKILGHIFPLTYFAENVRKIALMGVKLPIMINDIYLLTGVGVTFIVLALIAFKIKYLGAHNSLEASTGMTQFH